MSAAEFQDFKTQTAKEIVGKGRMPEHKKVAHVARKRFAKNYINTLAKLRRKKWSPSIVPVSLWGRPCKENPILDQLVPNRKKIWVPPVKRRSIEEIVIDKFSFLDHPEETFEALAQIARCDATAARYQIHFDLKQCDDISPFVVLGLMRRNMIPAATGGRMARPIQVVLEASGLIDFLKMAIPEKPSLSDVWPLMFREKAPGQADAESQTFSALQKEKVADDFVRAIDDWLGKIGEDGGYTLTKNGKATISTIFSELLDNAERHTIKDDDRAGGWYVAGFMVRRPRVDGSPGFICHLTIISPGMTFGESLLAAEDAGIRSKLDEYCRRHRRKFGSDEAADCLLWTVCALQDRVSQASQTADYPHGGVGLMEMIDVVNALGGTASAGIQPQVTIYSGRSCVMVKDCYNQGKRLNGGIYNPRTLWFNPTNSIESPPDDNYVFSCSYSFPGTVVAVRFGLDSNYLSTLVGSKNANN